LNLSQDCAIAEAAAAAWTVVTVFSNRAAWAVVSWARRVCISEAWVLVSVAVSCLAVFMSSSA
jgi:hypothetical protein